MSGAIIAFPKKNGETSIDYHFSSLKRGVENGGLKFDKTSWAGI